MNFTPPPATIAPFDTGPMDKFEPFDLEKSPSIGSGLPPELWSIVQSAPATFPPHHFLEVSRELLENPNRTSSLLFRAEILYSSFTDTSFNPSACTPLELSSFVKHMKAEYQPRIVFDNGQPGYPGYSLEWTVVRKLIPRNPNIDPSLVQTCHLFSSTQNAFVRRGDGEQQEVAMERYLVVYIPHITDAAEMPFYHPRVRRLAVLYAFQLGCDASTQPGTLSIYYDFFPGTPLDNRMSRTALNMLRIIHKHSRGRMQGYKKRVHHDLVVPQKAFQDTYTYLKGKYAQMLVRDWVEQTPPDKHVFEDLGIAAFLIELWTDMYGQKGNDDSTRPGLDQIEVDTSQKRGIAQKRFPGFVDVGCGNGILVYILRQEGWNGWGFDARRRKTWNILPTDVKSNLMEMLLVPEIFSADSDAIDSTPRTVGCDQPEPLPPTQNGIFAAGTFIIANHADELTIWTPCLAFLSQSPFIAIPCCSHNFAGSRFRAPATNHFDVDLDNEPSAGGNQTDGSLSSNFRNKMSLLSFREGKTTATSGDSDSIAADVKLDIPRPLPVQTTSEGIDAHISAHEVEAETLAASHPTTPTAPEKSKNKPKTVSAYASFCAYITNLTAALGYEPEKEVLRIPSTRNVAILGRKTGERDLSKYTTLEQRLDFVTRIVEKEMGLGIAELRADWLKRGSGLMKPGKAVGH